MEGHGEANETSNLIREWLGKPIQAKGRCYRNEKYEFGCRGRVVFKKRADSTFSEASRKVKRQS